MGSKIRPAALVAALLALCLAVAAIVVLSHRRRGGGAGEASPQSGRGETAGGAVAPHGSGDGAAARGDGKDGGKGTEDAAGAPDAGSKAGAGRGTGGTGDAPIPRRSATAPGPEQGRGGGGDSERRIERIYITTAQGTPYQIRKVYAPRKVPLDGIPDAAAALEAAGYSAANLMPGHALLFESETETRINTFGRTVVTVGGLRQWVDPATGNVLAFDFAQTTGSAPQRIRGHLVKGGFRIRRVVEGEEREGHTISLPPQAAIPPDMDFVHRYFAGLVSQRRDPRVPEKAEEGCTFDLFFPEAAARLLLSVKPAGVETLSVGGRNMECARYEAWAAAATSAGASGARSRQTLFFSRGDGRLVRRDDYDEAGEKIIQITELAAPDRAGEIADLVIAPPKLDPRKFDWPSGEAMAFRVFAGDRAVGAINIAFRRTSDAAPGREEYEAEAHVDLSVAGARRRERAVTRFDSAMRPVRYSVEGRETVEHEADYSVEFSRRGGSVELRETKKYRRPAGKPDKGGAAGTALPPPDPPDRKLEFPLSEGVFLFDHHRVEHAIALFSQIPLVHDSRVKAGVFLVRRNLPAVVEFYIRDLRRAAGGSEGTRPDGAVWEISSGGVALPGRALLDGNGRLVSFSLVSGGLEMSYVSAAAKPAPGAEARLKSREIPAEGPRPLRPPGW